jgi:hypothetical protein
VNLERFPAKPSKGTSKHDNGYWDSASMNSTSPPKTIRDPDTIKNLKMTALEEDRNYEIVEEAVLEWLSRHKKKAR